MVVIGFVQSGNPGGQHPAGLGQTPDDFLASQSVNTTEEKFAQLQADGLYPGVSAPDFSPNGGSIVPPIGIVITRPGAAGTIYYTTDGTDPRTPFSGGAVAFAGTVGAGALDGGATGTATVPLIGSALIKARVLDGGVWSALTSAQFTAPQDFSGLKITELMYHPQAAGLVDGDEYEFVELKNTGATTLDLSGVYFSAGITYVFPPGSTVAAGGFVVLPRNLMRYNERYGSALSEQYVGSLDNDGETITVNAPGGAVIASVAYGDASPWPLSADGSGVSLVPTAINPTGDANLAANWRASTDLNGSPGTDDPAPAGASGTACGPRGVRPRAICGRRDPARPRQLAFFLL